MTESVTALAELTTLRVGGRPTRLVVCATTDGLVEAARRTWADGDDWLVVGGGSNLLAADAGFPGTVLLVRTRGVEVVPDGSDAVRLRVAAGEPWDDLVARTVERGWTGLEALSGIPGTTGASPVQNVGAYGVEVGDVLAAVEFLDADTGERAWLPVDELGLGYRTSVFKRGRRGVVLTVEFRLGLADGRGVPVRYPQLATALAVELGAAVAPTAVRSAVLGLRAAKGMVLDPTDADTASAGSFFTNPIVSPTFAATLPLDAPRWPVAPDAAPAVVPLGSAPAAPPTVPDERVKLSAAWLIEHAGVHRGFALPGSRAAVSSKHTLALTNRGGASASEVAELARYVQTMVMTRFGVALVPEPVVVGDLLDSVPD
ncbi:UDP-N-acetylmuramate dehydrogenase [Curtobacterium sp. MCBD17_028]|nr:UDP-N-acetylmuramate dehydrogenase [Curtobacterium sp. MCBD17_028]